MTDRRAFLRSLGAAAGLLGAGWAGACAPDEPARAGPGPDAIGGMPRPLTRPLLRQWASDIVWVDTPGDELPVAYVSMERRQLFVDHAYRDRAMWLLDAHISVSTALWRIPLPGDPVGQPITPGDAEREFEERPMRAWDPSMTPSMDDVRIVRGRTTRRRIDFSCVPLVGGLGRWVSGGPFDVPVSDRGPEESTREDFRVLGIGQRWSERRCATSGEVVQLVGWAARD